MTSIKLPVIYINDYETAAIPYLQSCGAFMITHYKSRRKNPAI